MAVASLIAGLLGLSLLPTVGSIIALITGYMAKEGFVPAAVRWAAMAWQLPV
jgi:hypothetical protein